MSTEKTPTPELDKMKAVQDKSQAIGEFLEHLGEKGLVICCYASRQDEEKTGYEEGDLIPLHNSIEKNLADYFGIDLNKVEQERRALLDELRQSS
jgi:hypothetical protein